MDGLIFMIKSSGPENSKLVVLTDHATWSDIDEPLSDSSGKLFLSQLIKSGIPKYSIRLEAICNEPISALYRLTGPDRTHWENDCLERLSKLKAANVIVALGEDALRLTTGKHTIDKWHLSIIPAIPALAGKKVVPVLHPTRVMKVFKEFPYLAFGAQRAADESKFPEFNRTKRDFWLNPSSPEIETYCKKAADSEWLSVDIETARGQIVCVGLSTSPNEAMCIPTLPRHWPTPTEFNFVWRSIAHALQGSSKKVFQNGIYDTTYFSKYGIRVVNFFHDTMIAQKFLHPELQMGLDYVARIYTREPYWKDDAKEWGARGDIRQLYEYNCKDASVTLEAAHAQRLDMKKRGLLDRFDKFIMPQTTPIAEMCWRGLPVDPEAREALRLAAQTRLTELESELTAECAKANHKPINPRSPAQVKDLLKAMKFRIPIKDGKPSSDKEALLKLKLKNPNARVLTILLEMSKLQKQISSYLTYEYDELKKRMNFTVSIHGTETERKSCYKDPWNRGINAQTIPGKLKGQFVSPRGFLFVEVDLRQAESRFVAWDAPEPTLIDFYRSGVDIHSYVASRPGLFNCAIDRVTKPQRQLGKKVGHGANYGMEAATFSKSCLLEMNIDVPIDQSQRMLESYHSEFPGIRNSWHKTLRDRVLNERKITTPLGHERYFYDRPGPDLWKEVYAYRPQNTVTCVNDYLMLHMFGHAGLLLTCHDSLLMEVPENKLDYVLERIKDQDAWNPIMTLAGGELRIPIEVKVGRCLDAMEETYTG